MPTVFTIEEALAEGAPRLHGKYARNITGEAHQEFGDVAAAFKQSDLIKTTVFKNKRQDAGFIEPQGCIAEVDLAGNLTLTSLTQSPHYVQRTVAMVLGLDVGKVRVVKHYVGAGFGPKAAANPMELACCLMALKTGKPVKALNPSCQIETHNETIGADTLADIARRCDLIIDGTDTIEARNVLNRIAVELRIPFIFGGVKGFDGMMAVFSAGRGSCLACMFPEPMPKAAGEIGIIGPTAGVIASPQCMEAIKQLIGMGQDFCGTLIHFHGLGPRLKKMVVDRNPECPVCAGKISNETDK